VTDWTKMRKTWTDARDKAKVKKGAVSGVSIGDAIDAVVKAEAKGYNAAHKASEALAAALGKYKTKLAKTNPDLVKWIDATLLKQIKDYQGQVALDLGHISWIKQYPLGDTIMSSYGLNPDSAGYRSTEDILEAANKPKAKKAEEEEDEAEAEEAQAMTWAQAAEQAKLFHVTNASLPRVGKRALDMSKLVWNAKLPGHDDDYAAIKKWAEALIEDVKYCAKWAKVDNGREFLMMLKGWGQRDTAYSLDAQLKKALASLSG
jgi:hypothetical protein